MHWALLDVVSDESARAVLGVARRRRFARNEVVFHEGDPGDTLHLIDKGRVGVRVTTPLGDTATIRIIGPGGFFGELAVVSPAPRNATIVALEPVETLGVHRDQIDEVRRVHPEVDRVLLEAAISEVRRLSTLLLEALYVPIPKRMIRRLVELAATYEPHDGPAFVPLTQDDLAGLCGSSRPTANKILGDLQDKNLIQISRGHISILDVEGLRRLSM